MTNNKSLQLRKEKVIARGMSNLHPIYIERADNAYLWDVEEKRYIDFAAGIAVNNTGHTNKRITEVVKAQLDHFSHTCSMVTPYASFVELAEALTEKAPGESEKKATFLTTGAEAVENAVKIARAYTKRHGVIAFNGGFHGRTNFCMGLTGKVAPYKKGFGPFAEGIYHAPYPVIYHGISEQESLYALKQLFTCTIDPENVAAIIFEPVQGEGGFYQAPRTWAEALRKICDQHGIVLIADEIQTGFARTGKLFVTEYLGIEPDLLTMAKGIAGGFPLSAVVGNADIMDAAYPGALGGTYAGSPLGCVAGLEVLKIIAEENLCEKALAIGEVMKGRLTHIQKECALIGDIRALGAMVAIELNDPETGLPAVEQTKQLVAQAREKGLILLACGIRNNVIRFLPPLTIPLDVIEEGLNIVDSCLKEISAT